MSESLPMLTDTVLSQEAGQIAGVQGKQSGGVGEATFPELFESVYFEGADASNPQMPPSLFPAQLTEPGSVLPADLVLPISQAESGPLVPVAELQTMQESGNIVPGDFPQIAWSGVFAASDGNDAAAMHIQGDTNQAISKVAYGDDMSAALRKLQVQAMAQEKAAIAQAQLAMPHKEQVANAIYGQGMPMMQNQLLQSQLQSPITQAHISEQVLLQENLPQLQLHTPLQLAGQASAIDLAAIGFVNRGSETVSTQINLPVNQPQWGQQVGDRVQWMISQNMQSAEIRLNPPELGSLEIRIQLQGDQANVNFTSPHGQVRDALDAALPRLREMLEESGLTLGDVNVSQQSVAQGHSQPGNESGDGDGNGSSNQADKNRDAEAKDHVINQTINTGMNGLDVYA